MTQPGNDTLLQALCVALGGALGSVSRWFVARWAVSVWGPQTPNATLVVNLLGSFLFGVIGAVLLKGGTGATLWRALLLTGFLGGLTTFSALMHDTSRLLDAARAGAAFGNLFLQCSLGLVLLYAGLWVGSGFTRGAP